MKLSIMQPYFFPYVGYFQLIHGADQFVIHDDVQFIKGGWINRNRILANGVDEIVTLSVKKDSSYKRINERFFSDQIETDKEKLLNRIQAFYRRAPYFSETFALVRECLSTGDTNISTMITRSLKLVCETLRIQTPFVISSQMEKNDELRAEARVIEICRRLGATRYVNPIGGLDLYSGPHFKENGIELRFMKSRALAYPQLQENFVPNLSMIDVLMFNGFEGTRAMLDDYDLLTAEEVPSPSASVSHLSRA